ncbi:MAG: prepilin-type N-terminal cleavage/methylation domain-containing protein [Paenisporosarcina sp.]|uniref:prepilin-type N-terminal cleavage/methylation domain-containing protein n=1 Tax=Paenisporosarcina sp. TaxID=1932001 RepID=UPI003C75E0A3
MRKFIQQKLKDQKGLTLIELLAVIVILAIIAAIAIPAIGNIIENSRYSAVKSDAVNALSAANIYFTENSSETTVLVSKLKTDKYLDSIGKLKGSETIAKPAAGVSTGNTITSLTTGGGITYSGSKSVTFTGATVETINGDIQKGSTNGATVTIP